MATDSPQVGMLTGTQVLHCLKFLKSLPFTQYNRAVLCPDLKCRAISVVCTDVHVPKKWHAGSWPHPKTLLALPAEICGCPRPVLLLPLVSGPEVRSACVTLLLSVQTHQLPSCSQTYTF
jgi:hypothetical protein